MDGVGQKQITIDKIRTNVLEVFPNLNDDTVYNTKFVPSEGLIDTIPLSQTPTAKHEDLSKYQIAGKSDVLKPFDFKNNLKVTDPA